MIEKELILQIIKIISMIYGIIGLILWIISNRIKGSSFNPLIWEIKRFFVIVVLWPGILYYLIDWKK